jgi:hypothetical protein
VLGCDGTPGFRRARRSEDLEPGIVLDRVRPQQVRLAQRLVVAGEVRDRQLGLQVEMRRNLAELEIEVDEEDAAGRLGGEGGCDADRDHRRPDTPLRAEAGDDASAGGALAVRVDERRQVARALEADQERLDAGLELPRVERLHHDVVGAGLEVADPLLDIGRLAHAEDGDRRERGRPADLAADVDAGAGSEADVENDEGEVGGPPHGIVRVGSDSHLVAHPGQRTFDGGDGGLVRLEDKDGARRHVCRILRGR